VTHSNSAQVDLKEIEGDGPGCYGVPGEGDETMAENGPVTTQSLIADDATPVPWAEACGRLAKIGTYWLATVRPNGRPHAVPVLAVWVDGALHFVASETSRKARNLAGNSHCVITGGSDGLDLVVEGAVTKVRDGARLQALADAYASKYGWHVTVRDGAFHDAEGAPTAGPPPFDVYQVTPTTAFAFGTEDETINASTRWRF
jgi:nitroimidazol reductase NimA-like FMN-containing flavoprotein (pyridoxamine 5'-phosphate oxidase superfamily)